VGGAPNAAIGGRALSTGWLFTAPLAVAALLAYVFEADAIELGAALGAGAFLSMLLARRPITVKFGALSLAGAVAFGFVAAVLAALFGISVGALMASEEASHLTAKIMGVAAVALAVFGTASIVWAQFSGAREED
jgi:hypothetical protein